MWINFENLIAQMKLKICERHNVFTEVINKIAASTNDDKRMQSIDSIETYAYGASQDIIHEQGKITRYEIIQRFLSSTMPQMKT